MSAAVYMTIYIICTYTHIYVILNGIAIYLKLLCTDVGTGGHGSPVILLYISLQPRTFVIIKIRMYLNVNDLLL